MDKELLLEDYLLYLPEAVRHLLQDFCRQQNGQTSSAEECCILTRLTRFMRWPTWKQEDSHQCSPFLFIGQTKWVLRYMLGRMTEDGKTFFTDFDSQQDSFYLFLFVLLLYVPYQQLWSCGDGQFT